MTTAPSDHRSESGWATLIGIIICLSGNVVISFALNIQRLAHERIQRRRQSGRRTHTKISAMAYGTVHLPKSNDGEDGEEEEEEENEALYLRSKLWWTGLVLMAIGEAGNFVACTVPLVPSNTPENLRTWNCDTLCLRRLLLTFG